MAINLLLSRLPHAEQQHLGHFMTDVELVRGEVLIEPNQPIKHIWFPETAVTSTVQALSDGSCIESGIIGLEGMVGLPVWLRQRQTPQSTFVQVPGRAKRMDADCFVREVTQRPSALNDLVAALMHSMLLITGQNAACNRLHMIHERFCRWLCMIQNRVPDRHEFPMRHESMAQMLGVQRPTLSIAASVLQKAGWIQTERGRIQITDKRGLESGACECYRAMEEQLDQIYGESWVRLAQQPQSHGYSGMKGSLLMSGNAQGAPEPLMRSVL